MSVSEGGILYAAKLVSWPEVNVNVRLFEEPLLGSSVNFDLTRTDGCFNAEQCINKVQLEVNVT